MALPYLKPEGLPNFSYGTAGFRMSYDESPARLESIVFRMGVVATLRARSLNAAVGIMVTASHNPECDNGLKLVEPMGEMLVPEWEKIAVQLVNCSDEEFLPQSEMIAKELAIGGPESCPLARVVIGRDTRKSSTRLAEVATDGVKRLSGSAHDAGILTTPQLHFLVRSINLSERKEITDDVISAYNQQFGSFAFVAQLKPFRPPNYKAVLHVDCANGVGAIAVEALTAILEEGGLQLLARNRWNSATGKGDGPLNDSCGADYVKLRIARPKIYDGSAPAVGERWASLDGDADRVIYFFLQSMKGEERFVMLDGDRMATLFAKFFKDLCEEAGLSKELKLGIVQTAYANGRSTTYITDQLGLSVSCVPTGVKFLHAEAARRFDLGVYFEANGHGTVLFSPKAHAVVASALKSAPEASAMRHLAAVMELVNEAIGDAITDVLLTEHILACCGWDLATWAAEYTDLPVCQLKVRVADRSVVTTEDAERRCVTPAGLQAAVERLATAVPAGRAFVRPSGTEDVVRVYAECEGRPEDAQRLATAVACEVFDRAGGVGPRPT